VTHGQQFFVVKNKLRK